jgi:hypothetical protein
MAYSLLHSVAALAERLVAQSFAKWQLPDRYEILTALPRTSTGKVWKQKLREQFPHLGALGMLELGTAIISVRKLESLIEPMVFVEQTGPELIKVACLKYTAVDVASPS